MDNIEQSTKEDAEVRHFQTVKQAFKAYQQHTLLSWESVYPKFAGLEMRHRVLLQGMDDHFAAIRRCVAANFEVLSNIGDPQAHNLFKNQPSIVENQFQPFTPSEGDIDKVRSTLRHLVRDWSQEGFAERDTCYSPILREIEATFPLNECNRADIRVLVPGCGLSRLAWEINQRGFCVQGNEMSLYMLMASDFILNRTDSQNQYFLYPWVHQTTNVLRRSDVLREVRIPDVNTAQSSPNAGDFSMIAGPFTEIYSIDEQQAKWNCVITSFFLDTATDVFQYIETIYHILPIGGHWINLGPLHYQQADLDLSLEDIKTIVTSLGFDIVSEDLIPTTYTSNPRSMLKVTFQSAFFHAVKTGRRPDVLERAPPSTIRLPIPSEVFPVNSARLSSDVVESDD